MNEAVKKLCRALLSVPDFSSPHSLREIFNRFKEVSLTASNVPEALRALERLVCEWENLSTAQYSTPERTTEEQQAECLRLRREVSGVSDEIYKVESTLSTLYQPLESRYNDALTAVNSLAATCHFSGNQQRAQLISNWSAELRAILATLELETARIDLSACITARSQLENVLMQRGITVDASSPDSIEDARNQLHETLERVRQRQALLREAIVKLAPVASTLVNSNRIKTLEEERIEPLERLDKIQQLLENVPELKSEWLQEWDQADDRQALLQDAERAASAQASFYSYVSISEWRDWKNNPHYAKRSQRAQFFSLMNEQAAINARLLLIESDLASLRPYASNADSADAMAPDTVNANEISQLLAGICGVVVPESPSVDTLYNAAVAGLEALEHEATGCQEKFAMLKRLDELQQRIFTIRESHALNPDSDALTLDESALEPLRGQSLERATKVGELQKLLKQCDDFINLSRRHQELLQKKRELERAIDPLKTKGEQQTKRRRRKAARSVDDPSAEVIKDIRSQMNILRILYKEDEQRLMCRGTMPPSSSSYETTSGIMETWMRHLAPLISKNLSVDWQEWYQRLLTTLQSASLTPEQGRQAIRLLRDFLADLSNENARAERLRIFYTCQQRYPVPEQQWQQLLALKADTPLINRKTALNMPKGTVASDRLEALYRQVANLNARGFHFESELLRDITLTLHAGALSSECAHSSNENVPVLFNRDDPRYTCLFRQRGFLLNLLERLSQWISSLWSHNEQALVRNQCFFKPTRTVALLDEAASVCQVNILAVEV